MEDMWIVPPAGPKANTPRGRDHRVLPKFARIEYHPRMGAISSMFARKVVAAAEVDLDKAALLAGAGVDPGGTRNSRR